MIDITQHGDVTRLRMHTWRSRSVGYDVSAYLVRGMLIDTGMRHVGHELDRALQQLRPRGVIVTHYHEDHAGNAPTLAERLPTLMPSYTERKLREQPAVKFYRHYTWGRPLKLTAALTPFDPQPLQIIPTPGHSPDHHIVFDPLTSTLFSGDLFLGVKARIVGAGENPYEIIDSLASAIELRPRRMFDAHRGLVDNAVGALQAKRDWLSEIVHEIERRFVAGLSEDEILHDVLDGEERTAVFSQGEYSRRNLVRAVSRLSRR